MVECLPSKQEVFASSSLVYCSIQRCSTVENNGTSKRNLKALLLCDELQYWGLVSQKTDMEAIKVMANVIPESMLMRMIDKLQRKRTNGREAS